MQDRDARLREKFEKMRKEKEEIQNELEKSEAERRQKEVSTFSISKQWETVVWI